MLVIIILLLILIVAVMLFGRAAVLAAIGVTIAYLALTLVAFFLAVPVADLISWDWVFGIVIVLLAALAAYGFWDQADQSARADKAQVRKSFSGLPPDRARRKQILRELRMANRQKVSGQVDIAPDDATDH